MERDLSPDVCDELHRAVRDNDYAKVRAMLDQGVPPDSLVNGMAPLYVAASRMSPRMIDVLVEGGANPNARRAGPLHSVANLRTALNAAATAGKLDNVARLLDHGADPNLLTDSSENAVHLLIKGANGAAKSRTQFVAVLGRMLDLGVPLAQGDRNGRSVLHVAVIHDMPPHVLELLMDRGADMNSPDLHGYSAFHWSCTGDRVEQFDTLMTRGADINAPNAGGRYPLHLCISAPGMTAMLSRSPNLEAQDHKGRTALADLLQHHAESEEPSERVLTLLAAGASLWTADYEGVTPRDIIRAKMIPLAPEYLAAADTQRAMADVAAKARAARPPQHR